MWGLAANIALPITKGPLHSHGRAVRNSKFKEKSISIARVSGIFSEGEVAQLKMGDRVALQESCALEDYWNKGTLMWSLWLQIRKQKLKG